jgi:simple sugar transport system permease protein
VSVSGPTLPRSPAASVRGRSLRVPWVLGLLVIAVLGITALLIVVGGADPIDAANGLVDQSLGTRSGLGETLLRFAPLALIAATLTPSLRAGLFNIGAPGQLGMGALAAGLVGLHLHGLPNGVLIAAAAIAAAAAGLAWGLIPALMRAHLGVNEILSTLVFNFLAAGLLSYLLGGPLQGEGANLAQSDTLSAGTNLPIILSQTRAHIGVLVALGAIIALAAYGSTPSGYRLRLFSASQSLAEQAGASERRVIIGTMLVGAAGAGLAGWMQVLGVDHLVYATAADPVGYGGLFVALLGALNPVGILIAAFLLAALLQGGNSLQVGVGVSPEITNAVVGLIVLAVAAYGGLRKGRAPR